MEENTNTIVNIETAVRTQPSDDATVEKLRRRLRWLDDGGLDKWLLLYLFLEFLVVQNHAIIKMYAVFSGKVLNERGNAAEQTRG